ncbi:MAG: MarR family winged helix-turn-helix transcriptional regulator [Tannerellaceae bacterium]|nr:MarR family winged helix-turn-helix transcriptional regulator [Tannerellaceae bacterium]
MEFFNQTGKMAIGSRLRMLTDKITEDASHIYQSYGTDLKPKWFPVFFILSSGETKTITSIAKEIGHSHPSVSNIIREMAACKLVQEKKDKADGRRNVVGLTAKGKRLAEEMKEQYADVTAAIENINKQTRHDLWSAIEEWEFLLSQKSLYQRVLDEKKARESKYVEIVEYTPNIRKLSEV